MSIDGPITWECGAVRGGLPQAFPLLADGNLVNKTLSGPRCQGLKPNKKGIDKVLGSLFVSLRDAKGVISHWIYSPVGENEYISDLYKDRIAAHRQRLLDTLKLKEERFDAAFTTLFGRAPGRAHNPNFMRQLEAAGRKEAH